MATRAIYATAQDALAGRWQATIRGMARDRAPRYGNGATSDDLEQVAAVAFWIKFDDWDQSRAGATSWMRRFISSAMRDCIQAQHHPVRAPVRTARQRARVHAASDQLAQELGREPTSAELATATGSTRTELVELQAKTSPPRSLDEIGPAGLELAQLLEDPKAWGAIDQIAIQDERRRHIDHALAKVPDTTAEVLRLTWGLTGDGQELDRSEIARRYGRSSEWVRLQLRAAERQIRHGGLDRTRRRNVKLTRDEVEHFAQTGDLAWYDLSRLDLTNLNLAHCDLRHALLQEANLQEADLWGADLRGADLQGANLRGADLQDDPSV
jgi:RNA polymerase sigma factor (sigma-70 family)